MRALYKRRILASTITILAVLAVLQVLPVRVEGATTGTVCIAQVTDTACPASPPVFNGPFTSPNTLLRVPVMINNTASFVGFDITLNSSDASSLRPYGVDMTGSMMPSGSITLVECVGKVLITGSICSQRDDPTTIHLAVVGPFGFLSAQGATGLLFTAIFSITGTTLPGGVTINFQNGCSNSSSGNLCVSVSNGTVSAVPEAVQTGGFDNSDTSLLPYTTLSTTTTGLGQSLAGAPTHSLPVVTYTAVSQNGFNTTSSATLNLSAAFNGTGSHPTLSLSTSSIDLTGVPTQTFTQTGSVASTVPAGVYVATVTATYQTQDMITFTTSSLSPTFSLLVSVSDYSISLSPNPVSVLPPNSQPVTVTIAPKAGFNNLVKLGVMTPAAAASAEIGATYSSSTISGGAGTSTLIITTTTSTPSGTYTLMVTSNTTFNGFTRVHTAALLLNVGSPGFQISANPTTLLSTPGNTGESTVTVASVNGFAGVVALSLTITPSSGLTCSLSPTVIALNFTVSGTSALSCSGSVGTYSIVITGNGGGQSHSASVSFMVQANIQGTVISVDPNATIDLARASKTISITVNLTGSPAINSVSVELAYDYRVLQASSLTYSSNVLAQTGYPTVVVRDCLDGHIPNNAPLGLCGTDDGLGHVSFAEAILGGTTSNATQGNIFLLTFNVTTTAPSFSQIQIEQAILGHGSTSIPVTTLDGYYTSLSCNGVPCRPPKVDFKWSPLTPTSNKVVAFYGNASLPSPNALITDYFWTFGDAGISIAPYRDSGTNSTVEYVYQFAGTYSVTLKVTESNGVIWSKTLTLIVIPPKPPNDFTLSGPDRVVMDLGQQDTFSVVATSFNFTGVVALSVISPQGLTVSLSSSVLSLTPASSALSSLTIAVSSTILPGEYVLTVTGTSGLLSHNAIVTVVVPPPNFFLEIEPSNQVTITSGSSATLQILLSGNLNTTIHLSTLADPLPSPNTAFNVTFTPASVAISPASIANPGGYFFSSMVIRPHAATPPGFYVIYVVGSNGSITRYASLIITVIGPPDFTIQTFSSTTQILAGSTGFVNISVQRYPCCPVQEPLFNVTLSVAISPMVPNGPRLYLQNNIITVSGSSYTEVIILTGPTTQPGNYTLTVTGTSGPFIHSASSTVIVLPPPILKVTPSIGPVGTKVQVIGSGFVFSQPGYYQTHLFWVTFDDQFLGEEVTSNNSFTFTFNVPDAQPGFHLVKALDLYTGVNATASFQVLAAPSALSVTIDTGSIYFPGDSAVVYVLVSQNGTMVQASNLQLRLTLIKPDGSNITLTVQRVSPGLFKATYAIPTAGPIGTYAILANAQSTTSVQGAALGSFEVKPAWLSSQGRNIATAAAAIGAIGMVGFAWKKGYLKRKQDDKILA